MVAEDAKIFRREISTLSPGETQLGLLEEEANNGEYPYDAAKHWRKTRKRIAFILLE
jgi:hypothetical protein